MQSDLSVSDGIISGTLKFIEGGLAESGPLAGDGHFMALKFLPVNGEWSDFDSVKVGLEPSQGTGLVEILNDPDKNGVFKVTSTEQEFVVETTINGVTNLKYYNLEDLYLEPNPSTGIDPSITEIDLEDMDGAGLTWEPETGVYTSSGLTYASIQYMSVYVEDNVELTKVTLNEDNLTIGSPSSNMYSFTIPAGLVVGDNTLAFETLDTNGDTLNYTWAVVYGGVNPLKNINNNNSISIDKPFTNEQGTNEGHVANDQLSGTFYVELVSSDYYVKDAVYETASHSPEHPTIRNMGDNEYSFNYSFDADPTTLRVTIGDAVGSHSDWIYDFDLDIELQTHKPFTTNYEFEVTHYNGQPTPPKYGATVNSVLGQYNYSVNLLNFDASTENRTKYDWIVESDLADPSDLSSNIDQFRIGSLNMYLLDKNGDEIEATTEIVTESEKLLHATVDYTRGANGTVPEECIFSFYDEVNEKQVQVALHLSST